MTLKSFPRGGKKFPEKRPSDLLFGKHEKIARKQRQKTKKREEGEETFVSNTAERLSYATISEGLIVLGCVSEVSEYDLMISLPGGIIGRAQVTDIGESYTNLLQNLIDSGDSRASEFKTLPELYSRGDSVVCYVKAVQPQEKWQIAISLEPRLINQNVNIAYLDTGSRLACTVSSVEDHGCVVDTGIASVRAFIPNKESGNEKCLFPGKQLLCYVKEIKTSENASTITLSPKQRLAKAASESEIKSLDVLMPGTRLRLYIKKVLSNGLHVSFGENCPGYVNQLYLDKPLAKYTMGMEITGALLYILPTVKFAYFSCVVVKPRDASMKPGDIVEEALALFRESGGVVLQLNESGARGFVPLKRTNVDYDKIVEKFVPGSSHKCRILSYSWMDGTYVCTMQHALMKQRYFALSDFKAGDVVKAKITAINEETGFVSVQIGKFAGQVSPENVADEGSSALRKLKVDKEVDARVLSTHDGRNKVYVTLKKSLVASDLPILADARDAQIGGKHHGTVIQIHKTGVLVKFFGDAKGWIPRSALDREASDVNWNYSIGQTIVAQIESVDKESGRMTLSVPTKAARTEEATFAIGEEVEGTIVESSTQGVYLKISKNDGQNVSTGFLPAGHMSPCPETAALLASKCMPGDTLSSLVFNTVPSLILTRTFLPKGRYRNFEKLKPGDCIPVSIRDLEPDGLRVIVPVEGGTPFGYVSYSNVSNFNLLHVHQVLFSKIMSVNKREQQLNLSLSLTKIYNGLTDPKSRAKAAVDILALHFNKLAELARNPFYETRPISSVSLGQRVVGKIEKVTPDGLVVKLQNNLLAIVSKEHYIGEKKAGDKISGTILWKNYAHELVELTTLPKLMHRISAKQSKQIQFRHDKLLRGRILMVTNWFILVLLKGVGKGTLAAMPARRHANDIQPDLTPYVVHSKIRCYVLLNAKDSDMVPICMVKSAFEKKYCTQAKAVASPAPLKRKKENQENQAPAKRMKTEKTDVEIPIKKKRVRKESEEERSMLKEPEEEEKPSVKPKRKKKLKKMKEEEDAMKTDSKDVVDITNDYKADEEKPRIPECGFFWDDKPDLNLLGNKESSDSEEETEQDPKQQKKKKLSAAERREQERQKEREIREREEALAANQLPNSVDQFDRLVLGSPDSSIIWLQYMAYHLQTTEIDKARAVARRAVKTINFREENERLNVWNAWLNLESKFGTNESLNEVFQEAVRTNDSLKIYTHMLTVHAEAGRQFELEKIVTTMIGKFKQNTQMWLDCGEAMLKMGLKEKSRHVMQRALQSLPASEHVNMMARFALMENRYGDKERSQTLFEQILSSYPKRVDVWSCYVDSLVKSNDIDLARNVLERAAVQTLPPRKMKTLFKKFIAFEEQHGSKEDVARVQRMAVEYVEKQCNRDA